MLHEFVTLYRERIIERAREKMAARTSPETADADLEHGVPLFLDQLSDTLRQETKTSVRRTSSQMAESALIHGAELRRAGFTVGQVVHGYGDVCQAITGLALELDSPVTVDEFKTLNRSLDEAIAEAVTEFARARDVSVADRGTERQGVFAHELRNLVGNALLAYEVLESGTVGIGGGTGAMLGRNLRALRDLVDRSLDEVRIGAGLRREPVQLARLIAEAEQAATIGARAHGLRLTVAAPEAGVTIDVNPQQMAAAIENLLQNAFKFSRPKGHVALRADTTAAAGRVLIEVEDECGGLPPGKSEELFRPFAQRGADRSGLGLGLTIARESVLSNGGELRVRSVPGVGCIFTIDLPRLDQAPETAAGTVDVLATS